MAAALESDNGHTLDMGDGRDRAMVRHAASEALAGRWDLPEPLRSQLLKGLEEALELARKDKHVRNINSCIKTAATLERLSLDFKAHDRLVHGLSTSNVELHFTFDSPGDDPTADALPEAEGGRLCP